MPGATPIQIDSIGCLNAGSLDRHRDGGALGDGDDRRWGNFSATRVRFYFSLLGPPPVRPCRGLPLRLVRPPVTPFAIPASGQALKLVPPIRAVHVAVVAVAAQVEHSAAVIDDALDLPEIVHSRARPQGTRPTLGTRATTLTSNASTRGDPGSER